MKHRVIEGLNLGGWLVLERWMTPSVFDGTTAEDEFTLSQLTGGKERIQKHRETFIQEKDWRWLSSSGIRYVRLPVGYWVFGEAAPYFGAVRYLDWAFEMAEKYDIKILLDLHGLKGSQNGEMHSGRTGGVEWRRYIDDHLDILRRLAGRYKDSPALWGIEIINEPKVRGHYFALLRYYRKAYKVLQSSLLPGTYTVFHDGFLPPLFSGTLRKKKDFPVLMDTHFYGVFPGLSGRLSPKTYDRIRRSIFSPLLRLTQFSQPVIVGEWSSVLPQPFFDRIPSDRHLALLGETIDRQRNMYSRAFAIFYWNYKTEGRGMFNYRSLVEDDSIR
jgi:glucan 1,3-beta-glucosidase